MKKIFFFLIVTTVVLYACKDKKETAEKNVSEDTNVPVVTNTAGDSTEIRTVINDFYNWYAKNDIKLMGYKLYAGIKKKDQPPYRINWDEVARYQQYIQDSIPQLGDEFLTNQKAMFVKADSAFKVDANDEVPYYFDYDWYTNTQEDPKYLMDEMKSSKEWAIVVKDNDATVDIKSAVKQEGQSGSVLKLEMKKENGKWTIARIGNE